jgi:Protein of unknown function (DUF3617)
MAMAKAANGRLKRRLEPASAAVPLCARSRHMRSWFLPAAALLAMLAASASAETALQAGLWEKSEKVTAEGGKPSSRSSSVCLKSGEANLERLLMMSDDEATARGCKKEVTQPGKDVVRMSLSCPASAEEPAVTVRLEVRFTTTSFEGTGTVETKPKDGPALTGSSALSGKRLGDC